MDEFAATIVGAGVIGLAVADHLSAQYQGILLIEKNTSFGQEISSRNSEVIHAGIYYPPEFLKAKFCVQGNKALYRACEERNIPHRRIGKLIIAVNSDETTQLLAIKENAAKNGVSDLLWLSRKEIDAREPEIKAEAVLFSPSTGIIDSHSLMKSLLTAAQSRGATVAFNSECTAVRQNSSGYEVEINRGEYRFQTKTLINAAGLHSDKVAAMAGIDIDSAGCRLRYCKGSYFWASPAPRLHHLVYPAPPKTIEYLGLHATIDLSGRVRFGPDLEYVDALDYTVDEGRTELFLQSVRSYIPGIKPGSLMPDMCGIRPKLHGPGEPNRDFVITDEAPRGLPGLINLIGIESPGLTSCLPIAQYTASLLAPYLE